MNAWDNEPTPLTDMAQSQWADYYNMDEQNVNADHARDLERQLRYARRLLEDWTLEDLSCTVNEQTEAFLAATKKG